MQTASHLRQPLRRFSSLSASTGATSESNVYQFNFQHLRNSESSQRRLLSIIRSCVSKTQLLQIHAQILLNSLVPNLTISHRFLTRIALPPFSDLDYSRRYFDSIPTPSVSQFNVMIRGYSTEDDTSRNGLEMYRLMREGGLLLSPDSISTSFAVKCCAKMGDLDMGLQLHARILVDGHQFDSLLMTTLMDFYSNLKRFDDACKVFDEISVRDVVVWNVLISCYIKKKRNQETLEFFNLMRRKGGECTPDDVTCLHLLQACGNLGAFDFGRKVHEFIIERKYQHQINVCNSLIAMYSQCGCLEKAYNVFKTIPCKNVVSWTTMISGLAMNGMGSQAIDLFREMQRMGIPPDAQTFTWVLSACSHSGMVNEGMHLLNQMRSKFRVAPNIHHYGCIVDLLSRAGLLNKAYQFITSMDVNPDSTIYRTLLASCRIHKNSILGEQILNHLIQLNAVQASDYMLLLNTYSSLGNWNKVTKLRKFMKVNEIQTTPGRSIIELNGTVHEFVVDDITHVRKDEIYEMLDEVGKQVTKAGYVVEVSSELHNLDVKESGVSLSYHSEKLAMAFGILVTQNGATIRVSKNLRTCVDCHSFAKFVSMVYDREIIIRDRLRFHRFREGRCSCNDYW